MTTSGSGTSRPLRLPLLVAALSVVPLSLEVLTLALPLLVLLLSGIAISRRM